MKKALKKAYLQGMIDLSLILIAIGSYAVIGKELILKILE